MSGAEEGRDNKEMRFHCLGVGAIGSLLATNLAQLPLTQVRLILKRAALAKTLKANRDEHTGGGSGDDGKLGVDSTVYLRLERNGLARKVGGLEVETTVNDSASTSPGKSHQQSTKYSSLIRHDPIDTLIITTKAQSTLPAIKPLLPRLSSTSTIVLVQNGMGVLETLLDTYWPSDKSDWTPQARPSFICATTSHGVWRKGVAHYVHAGLGDLRFGIVPNRLAIQSILATENPSWGDLNSNNPILNPRSLTPPTLDHLPLTEQTRTLHSTLSAFLSSPELQPSWLPLPTLQIAQLQKLAVNAGVNALTAVLGVHNGAIVGSKIAKEIIEDIMAECGAVYAAHLAAEEGKWVPPTNPIPPSSPPIPSGSNAKFSLPDMYTSYDALSNSSPHSPPPPPLTASHPLSTHNLTDYTLRVLFKNSTNLSSTLQDLLRTSPNQSPRASTDLEINFINGYITALGEKYGIATPVNRTVGQMAKLKEEMIRSGAIDKVYESRLEKEVEEMKQEMSGSIFTPQTKVKKEKETPQQRRDRFLAKQRSWDERDRRIAMERREDVQR